MYAIVRKNTYDPGKLADAPQQLAKFDAEHARQPGFRGTISIDVGDSQVVVVNLWESREAAKAGQKQMRPVAEELIQPLLTGESTLVGEGPIREGEVLVGAAA
jgi:heme-degrading monooxygenase HmoA